MNANDIEPMDHLIDDFPEKNYHGQSGNPIKVRLLYVVCYNERSEEYDPNSPFKIISVKVPGNTPIYQIRGVVRYIETKLKEVFDEVIKLDIVLVSTIDTPTWVIRGTLPTYGVRYE